MGGFRAFKQKNKMLGNHFLKLRVLAQGATVVAMLAGAVMVNNDSAEKRKEEEAKALGVKKAQREAWLQELDRIDQEEKAVQTKLRNKERIREQRKALPKEGEWG